MTYTHLLMGPEQAVHINFLRLLRSSNFASRIAFVGIDELHIIHQWKSFRISYPDLHVLRQSLPYSIPWFGCTATLTKEAEPFVRLQGGFRPRESGTLGDLRIIRTPCDRPDTIIILQFLESGAATDFRRLEFVLLTPNDTVDPRAIQKTIIYIDNKTQLRSARKHLVGVMRAKGYTQVQAVTAIRQYDASTSVIDQTDIYTDFSQIGSKCRVILATVALGMGMDIPDVKRVVQYGAPVTGEVADIFQRFGRANRAGTDRGLAYLFLPVWYFDRLSTVDVTSIPTDPAYVPPVISSKITTPATAQRTFTANVPSGLSQQIIHDVIDLDSDAESVASYTTATFGVISPVESEAETESGSRSDPDSTGEEDSDPDFEDEHGRPSEQPVWFIWSQSSSKGIFDARCKRRFGTREHGRRLKLAATFPNLYGLANAPCFRVFILRILQEPGIDLFSPDRSLCCNACNPTLGVLPDMPAKAVTVRQPRAGTAPGFMMLWLKLECARVAQDIWESVRGEVPWGALLTKAQLYGLSRAMASHNQLCPIDSTETLVQLVPIFEHWTWLGEHSHALVATLPTIWTRGWQDYIAHQAARRAKRVKRSVAQTPAGKVYPAAPTAGFPVTPHMSFSSDTTLVEGASGTNRGSGITIQSAQARFVTPYTKTPLVFQSNLGSHDHRFAVGPSPTTPYSTPTTDLPSTPSTPLRGQTQDKTERPIYWAQAQAAAAHISGGKRVRGRHSIGVPPGSKKKAP
jgi:hypothetical protein